MEIPHDSDEGESPLTAALDFPLLSKVDRKMQDEFEFVQRVALTPDIICLERALSMAASIESTAWIVSQEAAFNPPPLTNGRKVLGEVNLNVWQPEQTKTPKGKRGRRRLTVGLPKEPEFLGSELQMSTPEVARQRSKRGRFKNESPCFQEDLCSQQQQSFGRQVSLGEPFSWCLNASPCASGGLCETADANDRPLTSMSPVTRRSTTEANAWSPVSGSRRAEFSPFIAACHVTGPGLVEQTSVHRKLSGASERLN